MSNVSKLKWLRFLGTIGYAKPRRCTSIWRWLCDGWCFRNRFGVWESGWRLFGVEVRDWDDKWAGYLQGRRWSRP